MKTIMLIMFALTVICGLSASQGLAQIQGANQVLEVKTIYLEPLGDDMSARLIREKIRFRLMRTNRFTVVDAPDKADAILTGSAGMERSQEGTINGNVKNGKGNIWGNTNTNFDGVGVFRLVDVKSRETLWLYDYRTNFLEFSVFGSSQANGEYNRIARSLVKQLLKDIEKAEKKGKQRNPNT